MIFSPCDVAHVACSFAFFPTLHRKQKKSVAEVLLIKIFFPEACPSRWRILGGPLNCFFVEASFLSGESSLSRFLSIASAIFTCNKF